MAAAAPKGVSDAIASHAPFHQDDAGPSPEKRLAASNPLILKLEHAGGLDEADRAALRALSAMTRRVDAGCDLSREGDRPETVHLVMEGLAYRYKILPDGKRQILGLLLPGDFCDLQVAILARRDHSIGTFTPCRIAEIPRATVAELIATRPGLARAFWWATLVDEGIMREWITSMGRRPAVKMVAHLFCELLVRLQAVGHATERGYELRMTQIELADLFGFTPVHVNRMLQELRVRGLISLRSSRLEITDVARLKAFCGFNANYLHMELRSSEA